MTGLKIVGEPSQPVILLFGDATVMSKDAVESALDVYPIQSLVSSQYAGDILFGDHVDSVIAVRMMHVDGTDADALAEARFEEVLTALILFSLDKHHFNSAYCASHAYDTKFFGTVSVCETTSQAGVSGETRDQVIFSPGLDTFTCSDLDSALKTCKLSSVIESILEPSQQSVSTRSRLIQRAPLFDETIRTALLLAGLRIVRVLKTQNPGDIVGAAVTCLEILLHTESVKDEKTLDRLDALVGFEEKHVQRIYRARNNWVHKGINCSSEDARLAIIMTVLTMRELAKLAKLAPAQVTHQALLQ